MVQLNSPGAAVPVTDESAYASPGFGTIPLLFVATAQDKIDPTGSETDGIAKYTKKDFANFVVPVTSQRELTQFFGSPTFQLAEGSETSEYGLLAAYSYLGQGSQVYAVRADVDLAELNHQDSAPTGPVAGGKYWLDTDASSYGVHEWSGSSWVLQSVTIEVDLTASSGEISDPSTYTPTATGENGDYLVAVLSDNTSTAGTGVVLSYFKRTTGSWVSITTTFAPHYNAPSAPSDGDTWVKTTRPGNGVNLIVYRSDANGEFDLVEVEGVFNGTNYVAQAGNSLTVIDSNMTNGNLALDVENDAVTIQDVVSNNATVIAEVIFAQDDVPTGNPTVGQLWFDNTKTSLHILERQSTGWMPVTTSKDVLYAVEEPTLDENGSSVESGDVWVDTSASEREYPKLYRHNGTNFVLHDNTDQTNQEGVLFANFSDGINTFDEAPDYQLHPMGMLAIDMGRSQNTVREYKTMFYNNGADTVDVWVNAAANNADGSGAFGRLAQRRVIANAMQAAVAGNEDLRDESLTFSLMSAPNYPELIDELVTLNSDRNETAFIITDVPMRKNPTESVQWVKGRGAAENGEDGLVTKYTYSTAYYPHVRTTTPAGNTVTAPASHAALYTYAYSDNNSYPWFAPAGLLRGAVRNGSAVGYITSEEEFKPISLNQGQRDAMYLSNLNPISNAPLEGPVLFGQKTFHPFASALDRVNVARLIAYLRERFHVIVRPLLFEPNDRLTRERARALFESFLSDLISKRALYDFAIVVDESNNTGLRIDRNELWIDIAIQPIKSVEFIYVPIRIVNTGAF